MSECEKKMLNLLSLHFTARVSKIKLCAQLYKFSWSTMKPLSIDILQVCAERGLILHKIPDLSTLLRINELVLMNEENEMRKSLRFKYIGVLPTHI